MKTVLKVLSALALIAGAVYAIATYGDKIVAWAKKLVASCPVANATDDEDFVSEDVASEEVPAEEVAPAEEAPASDVVSEEHFVEEAPAEETPAADAPVEPVADEADFEA